MRNAARSTTVFTVAALALTACGGGSSPQAAGDQPGSNGDQIDTGLETGAPAISDERTAPAGQAPDLEEQVESGELPPLEERLPEEAVTIIGADGPGQYGGEMAFAMGGADDDRFLRSYVGYEPLVRWDADWTDELQPGVAQDWEVSEDGTTFTFHLEEGIRWSDGEPFTADDLVFGYEDVRANEEIEPAPNDILVDAEGNFPEITALDDYTVELEFSVPNGLFLLDLARGREDVDFHRFPRHYLEQYHIDYNPDADQLAEEEGYDNWAELFNAKGNTTLGAEHDARWINSELPVINAWIIETPAYEGTRATAVRNPYYWKVDEEGNQLPYVDRMVFDFIEGQESVAFRAAGGHIAHQERHIDHDFRPLLAESMEEHNFSLLDIRSTDMNTAVLMFNHHHEDEDMAEIFSDHNFKAGLSHALDREELIELIYFGQGEPAQVAPQEDSPYYNERLATQYLDYDVDLANEMLDEVLPETDENGMRLGPDGEPFTFAMDVASDRSVEHVDLLQLVQGYWEEVGVTMEINTMDRDLRNELRQANNYDAQMRDGSAGLLDAILRPYWYMPTDEGEASFAPLWAEWYYTDGESGIEPPEDHPVHQQWELYDEIMMEPDAERQAELFDEVLELSADTFWAIGVSTSPNRAGVVHNDLRNAPHITYEASPFMNPGPAHPESWWWETPEDQIVEEADQVQEDAEQDAERDLPTDD
ncbi:ABC transporter substrate-binding protein [Nesterenkonia sp. MY13]|uniref:ABC transporter substrate-binding protein n=1 Tax=Nesterenkonia sedimenti TaxID=1463632 RepID=A0A7X8YD58_9MICC|nr:ABC transporter substrate-binding protein [Nesterenkonia sedimenti]NLS09041.1 ABC transporter substrate-binding protein [Nesterenkonia sedimenti]